MGCLGGGQAVIGFLLTDELCRSLDRLRYAMILQNQNY